MLPLLAAAVSASLVFGCKDASERESSYLPTETEVLSTDAPAAPDTSPAAPLLPDHNYDEKRGWNYYYVAAISDEDRKNGRAAGGVSVYQYLGLNDDGRHVLANMNPNGSVSFTATCSSPCRIIDHSLGGNFAYSPESIIGAAFQDAMRGKLAVADWAKARTVEQAPPLAQTPTDETRAAPEVAPADDEPWEGDAPVDYGATE